MARKTQAAQRQDMAARLAPGRVLRIYGMRRSGNHAVINWLQRNLPGGSVFLNNCHPRRDPLVSHRSLEIYAEGGALPPLPGAGLPERLVQAGPAPTALVSFEDAAPPAPGKPFAPLFAQAPETVVLIYRAFLNWSASLLRKILGNAAYGPVARARIMTGALAGYGRMLERVREAQARGFVAICYDRWHGSAAYREGVLGVLGLPVRDNGLGAVQRYGGGSSFEGKAADAAALGVDARAAQMADHPEYQVLLWTAAQDAGLMAALARHFPQDARRLAGLAETARISVHLPGPGADGEVPA